jgi:hypothetical protein
MAGILNTCSVWVKGGSLSLRNTIERGRGMDIHKVTFDLTGKVIETESDESWRDDFLRALGYLVVQSNYLEDALKDLYWIVTKQTWPKVYDDLRRLTLGPLVEKVVDAFEKRFPTGEFKDRLDRFKPDLERAVEVRNQYVHASWAFDNAKAEMEHRRLPRQAGRWRSFGA